MVPGMQLRLLGPVQLYDAGGPVHVGGPKERTVLAVLAIEAGSVVLESTLIEALWPQDPPRTAARTLQSYVSRLRKTLGATDGFLIDAVPGGYRLRTGHGVLDVHRVEVLAADAREAREREDPERAAASLAEALSAWSGRPLGEFADEPWAGPATARLAELQRTLLEERIDADLACGRHALLVGELEGLCRSNPFRERLWAQRMVALYRSGRQADALAVGREIRSRLVDELGVDPGPDLQALERAILMQDESLAAPTPPVSAVETGKVPFPAALATAGLTSFVGRANELEMLTRCWQGAADGTCRAVFVGGEPGIGKSRLVAEFARRVHSDGAIVLLGACEEDLDVPYQPFAEALRPFVARCSLDILRNHVRRYGGDIARVVPELALRLSDVPPPMHAEPEAERFRLFEATAAIIDASAAKTPVLIVIDDLQWANKPTLLMLRHLLRQTGAHHHTMIIGLYRDTETSDVLTDTLAHLRSSSHVERITLGGLDADGVMDLLEALADEKLPEQARRFAQRLTDETGGSPFYVGEVVLHFVETGAIARVDDGWIATVSVDQFELPASIREVIGRRFGRLAEHTRSVLSLAAVAGQTFTLPLLERSDGIAGDGLLDAIEEASDNGMIRDVPGAPGTYGFVHALIRRTLYDDLSVLRRARMHRRIAESLETAEGAPRQNVAEIAMHYLEGAADGVAPKAIRYASLAAAEAIDRAAFEEAVRFYEQAIEVADWASLTESTIVCDLLIGYASALWKSGAVIPSRQTYKRAAELARILEDAERFGVAALRTLQDLGGFAHAMRSDQDYIELLEEALATLGDRDTGLHALLLARLSVELFFTPFAEEHRSALADRAVSIAERLGDPRILLFTLHCREWATAGPDLPTEERLIRTGSILRVAKELGDVEVQYQARFLRFVTFLEVGDFHRADEEATEGHLLASQLGIPGFVPWVTAYDALRAWVAGDLDDADRLSAQALQQALEHRADPDLVFAVVGAQSVLFRYLRGLGESIALIEPMVGQFPDFIGLESGLALGYMQAGDAARCREYYEQIASKDFADIPREGTWLLSVGMSAVCCAYLKDTRRAEILYDMLLPFRDRWVATVVSTLGPMERVLGKLAQLLGRTDAAVEHLERAVALTGAVPAPLFHAEACYDLALVLETADPERASELVTIALKTSDELGLDTLRTWAEPLAGRLSAVAR